MSLVYKIQQEKWFDWSICIVYLLLNNKSNEKITRRDFFRLWFFKLDFYYCPILSLLLPTHQLVGGEINLPNFATFSNTIEALSCTYSYMMHWNRSLSRYSSEQISGCDKTIIVSVQIRGCDLLFFCTN